MSFTLTKKQNEAQIVLAGKAPYCMLFGGSRSGKTFLFTRNVIYRAIKAPNSRHLMARFRLNHIINSIVLGTFPEVMRKAFEGVKYTLNKKDLCVRLHISNNDESEIWFAGLDDKERTEKILGNEYATIYLNECSQIPKSSKDLVITRLAQKVETVIQHRPNGILVPRMYFDCNPPPKSHWSYQEFVLKRDPETKLPLARPEDYVYFQINPQDNKENLSDNYIQTLEGLSQRLQKRFLKGEFADATPNQLFKEEDIDKWRHISGELPDFVRVVIGVDPSGSGDVDNADNDAIGIVAGALGTDGNAYLLEDITVKAGPATWGRIATDAYDRLSGDVIVGEINYGGAMVGATIQTARPRTPYKTVTATRGKAVRAEPFSALYEQGKVRHVGNFAELEDELTSFSTVGYLGERSPNRADAWIWVLSELFPAMVKPPKSATSHIIPQTVNHFRNKLK